MRLFLSACLMFFLTFSATLSGQTRSELQKMYLDFLDDNGFEGEIDPDGDIIFDYDGLTYFIEVNEDDLEYFRLVLANIWPIESKKEHKKVLVACDFATGKVKAAKVYTAHENVWVSYECFIANPRDFEAVFERALEHVSYGKDYFVRGMKEK